MSLAVRLTRGSRSRRPPIRPARREWEAGALTRARGHGGKRCEVGTYVHGDRTRGEDHTFAIRCQLFADALNDLADAEPLGGIVICDDLD